MKQVSTHSVEESSSSLSSPLAVVKAVTLKLDAKLKKEGYFARDFLTTANVDYIRVSAKAFKEEILGD